MIVTTISDGFGNQLFMYAAGYALAKRLGMPLWLETSRPETDPLREYELGKLTIECGRVLSVKGLRWRPLMKAVGKMRRSRLKARMHFFREKEPFTYDGELLRQPDGTFLHGFWQNHRYFHGHRATLRRLFSPRVPLGAEHDAWRQRIDAAADSVSVHVRRGDYVGIGCALSAAYYRTAVQRMRERHPGCTLFVFSDDAAYARELFAGMGVPFTLVQAESPEPTLSDFFLMSRCRHHIIANSSYSWWAAYLGADDATVIAPLLPPWTPDFPLPEWEVIPAERC